MKKADGVSLSYRETRSSNHASQQFLDVITIYHNQQDLERPFFLELMAGIEILMV